MKKTKLFLTAGLLLAGIAGAVASSSNRLEEYFYQNSQGQYISTQSEVQCHVLDVPGCKVNIPGVGSAIQLYKQTSPGVYRLVNFD